MVYTDKERTPTTTAEIVAGAEDRADYISMKEARRLLADAVIAARPELAELYSRADLQTLADEFALRLVWAGRLNRRMHE